MKITINYCKHQISELQETILFQTMSVKPTDISIIYVQIKYFSISTEDAETNKLKIQRMFASLAHLDSTSMKE